MADRIEDLKDKLEGLRSQPENDAISIEVVKVYCELAYALHSSDPEQAESYANQALGLAERIEFKKGMAESHTVMGTIAWVRGNYEKALGCYTRSLRICDETGDIKGVASCYSNLGNILKNQGNYERALEYHLKALKIKEEITDKPGLAKSYNNIGIIYDEWKEYDNALAYYSKAIQLFEELEDKQGIAFSYNNIGVVYESQVHYAQAIEYYHKSLVIKEEIGDKRGIASSYMNIGSLHKEQEEYDRALEYSSSALDIFEEIGDKRNIAGSNNQIGSILSRLKSYDSALIHLQKGLQLSLKIGMKENEGDSYQYLSELYQAQGDFEQALTYYRKYSGLRENIFNDTSAEKTAQMQVRYETEKKAKEAEIYRGIFENTPIGMYRISPEKHILMANFALVNMLGYSSSEDLVRYNLHDEPCNSEYPFLAFSNYFKDEDVVRGQESIWSSRNGSSIYVRESCRSVRDESGNIVHYEGTVEDITNIKQAEDALRESEDKLQKLESLGTLAGGIAHDFNNLLTSLFGNIAIAKMKLSEDHPGFRFLEEAENAMNRATNLTRQLLTFAKGGEPVKENVNLGEIVRDVTRFDLSGSNVMPVFEFKDDLWIANIDKGQIQQVFSNLTMNASQSMPDGGHLYIKLENVDNSEHIVPNLDADKYIKVTVRDEGTGIDKKHLHRIFDPYFSTKQTGSGLGLSMVYSIITRHKGQISTDSKPGTGTTFTLYLPASDARQLKETEQSGDEPSILERTTRILVMDDEDMVLGTIASMLEIIGYSIETSTGGEQAIEMYKQSIDAGKPFDIVIMDLTIPAGIGGKEAVKELLKINPEAKVIASSGYSTDPIMTDYSKYGFRGRLAKPFSMVELKKEVTRVIEER